MQKRQKSESMLFTISWAQQKMIKAQVTFGLLYLSFIV